MELSQLEKLSGIPGVTGDTAALIRSLAGMAEGYARWEVDPLGNLIVYKEGAARRESPLLLWTPVDEPGLRVTGAGPDGSFKFILSGDLDRRTVPGRRVIAGERQLAGVVGGKAVHHAGKAEREKPVATDQLRLDVGAADAEEAEALVRKGDTAAFAARFERLGESRVKGRMLGWRAGAAVLLSLIRAALPYDAVFAFTVLNQAGGGSAVVANRVRPARAVLVCPVPADDTPGGDGNFSLGAGPVLPAAENRGVMDKGLAAALRQAANACGIPAQLSALTGKSGVSGVQQAAGGVRAAVAGYPARYLRSPAQVLDIDDLQALEALLRAYLAEA